MISLAVSASSEVRKLLQSYGFKVRSRESAPPNRESAPPNIGMEKAPPVPLKVPAAPGVIKDKLEKEEYSSKRSLATSTSSKNSQQPTAFDTAPRVTAPLASHPSLFPPGDDGAPPGVPTMKSKKHVTPPNEDMVLEWRCADVCHWVEATLELPQYKQNFKEAAVDGRLLLSVTDEDLKDELGIESTLHRRKFVQRIAELHELARDIQDRNADMHSGQRNRHRRKPKPKKVANENEWIRGDTSQLAESDGGAILQRTKLQQAALASRTKQESRVKDLEKKESNWKFSYDQTSRPSGGSADDGTVRAFVADDVKIMDALDDGDAYIGAMAALSNKRKFDDSQRNLSLGTTDAGSLGTKLSEMPIRSCPQNANTDEVVQIVREAMWDFSQRAIAERQAKKQTLVQDMDDLGPMSDNEGEGSDILGGGDSDDPLSIVFAEFLALKNNGAKWLGHHQKLTRLKMEGGMRALLRLEMSWDQFDRMFRRANTDVESGTLSYDEFRAAFNGDQFDEVERRRLLSLNKSLVGIVDNLEANSEMTLTQLFQAFDRDNSGTVSYAEFCSLVRLLAPNMSKKDLYAMMAFIDNSGDRRIQRREFLVFFYTIWRQHLDEVKRDLDYQNGELAKDFGNYAVKAEIERLGALQKRLKRVIARSFDRKFRDEQAESVNSLEFKGPFTSMLERMGMQTTRITGGSRSGVFSSKLDSNALLNSGADIAVKTARKLRAEGQGTVRESPVSEYVMPKTVRGSGLAAATQIGSGRLAKSKEYALTQVGHSNESFRVKLESSRTKKQGGLVTVVPRSTVDIGNVVLMREKFH